MSGALSHQEAGPHPWRFSRHAEQRLQQRQIELTPRQLYRLFTSCNALREKPGKTAAVLLDDWIFIVAVQSGRVVTAVEREPAKPQLFTDLDSVALA